MGQGRKQSRQTSPLDKINWALELLKGISDNIPGVIHEVKTLFGPPALPSPPPWKSPYDFMVLPTNCSQEDLKKRYREMAKIFHTDKGAASDLMIKELNRAREEIMKEKGWT